MCVKGEVANFPQKTTGTMLTHTGQRPHQSLERAKRVAAACHRCGNAAPKALVHVRCVVNLFNITIAVNYEKKY